MLLRRRHLRESYQDNGLILTHCSSDLVSLFNGISTFCRLFNAKAILIEEQ